MNHLAIKCEFLLCVCVCVCSLHVDRKPLMRVYSALDNRSLDAPRGKKSRIERGRNERLEGDEEEKERKGRRSTRGRM